MLLHGGEIVAHKKWRKQQKLQNNNKINMRTKNPKTKITCGYNPALNPPPTPKITKVGGGGGGAYASELIACPPSWSATK